MSVQTVRTCASVGVWYFMALWSRRVLWKWARKLMPGHPDPRMNLAKTLESAGRTDEALAAYGTALEVAPEQIAAMQAMASLQLRTGKSDDRTPDMLREIALRGDDESWRTWAQGQLAMHEGW